MKPIYHTLSFCPICKKRVKAAYIGKEDGVYLEKYCATHETLSTLVWKGDGMQAYCGEWSPRAEENSNCPFACGLCKHHQNQTCCVILEITERCNQHCAFCFANSGNGKDMELDEVYESLDRIYEDGNMYLHISGGEPTVHPKILDIVSYAKRKGFRYIQLNTNGIRIAEDTVFSRQLAAAGVSCVFLQFDGTNDGIYTKIRGEALWQKKQRTIDHCDSAGLGVVLVPTIIAGINDGNIGEIIRYGISRMPTVRGIHFQPVAYTGRYRAGQHFTIPELLRGITEQTNGLIQKEDIRPSGCDAPLCGFYSEYRKSEANAPLVAIKASGCCSSGCVERNQKYVRMRWTREKGGDSFDNVLKKLSDQSFTISAMFFQDSETLDLGRTGQCSLHVYRNGKYMSLCIYNNVIRREKVL